ncbi:MAG: hypothetical protein LBE67_03775 [Kocuria palustris]|nr:hypothetical protein [Kocuria palustris]
MLRPPGAPARAPSPAAPGSVIAGPGMQAGLAPLAWRDGRGPAVISARSMSARLGSAAPGAPRPPCGMSWPACCRSWRFRRPSRRADPGPPPASGSASAAARPEPGLRLSPAAAGSAGCGRRRPGTRSW